MKLVTNPVTTPAAAKAASTSEVVPPCTIEVPRDKIKELEDKAVAQFAAERTVQFVLLIFMLGFWPIANF
jgi:hypothetical protein